MRAIGRPVMSRNRVLFVSRCIYLLFLVSLSVLWRQHNDILLLSISTSGQSTVDRSAAKSVAMIYKTAIYLPMSASSLLKWRQALYNRIVSSYMYRNATVRLVKLTNGVRERRLTELSSGISMTRLSTCTRHSKIL